MKFFLMKGGIFIRISVFIIIVAINVLIFVFLSYFHLITIMIAQMGSSHWMGKYHV